METVQNSGISITREQFEKNYIVVSVPEKETRKLKVKAGNCTPYHNENIARVSPRYSHSYLLNLRAVDSRRVESVIEAFGNSNSIDVAQLRNMTMVHEIIVSANSDGEVVEPELPISGETIEIIVANAVDKEGEYVLDQNDQKIVNIRNFKILPASVAPSFSFGSTPLAENEPKETKASKEEAVEA